MLLFGSRYSSNFLEVMLAKISVWFSRSWHSSVLNSHLLTFENAVSILLFFWPWVLLFSKPKRRDRCAPPGRAQSLGRANALGQTFSRAGGWPLPITVSNQKQEVSNQKLKTLAFPVFILTRLPQRRTKLLLPSTVTNRLRTIRVQGCPTSQHSNKHNQTVARIRLARILKAKKEAQNLHGIEQVQGGIPVCPFRQEKRLETLFDFQLLPWVFAQTTDPKTPGQGCLLWVGPGRPGPARPTTLVGRAAGENICRLDRVNGRAGLGPPLDSVRLSRATAFPTAKRIIAYH